MNRTPSPSPAEIQERAAAIRREWSDGEYEHPEIETWMQQWEREYFAPLDQYLQQPLGAYLPDGSRS